MKSTEPPTPDKRFRDGVPEKLGMDIRVMVLT